MAGEPVKQQASQLAHDDEPTIGGLFLEASRDISTLVSKEIQLAKSELKVSIRHGGVGAGFFAGAAFIAVLAIIMLSVAIAYFISMTGLHLAWCFLIVFVLYLLITAVLGFIGYKQVTKVKAPERTIHQGKQIPSALKGRA